MSKVKSVIHNTEGEVSSEGMGVTRALTTVESPST